MARAVERNWSGAISGLVVTRYGFEADCDQIEIACASHPVPDRAGLAAAPTGPLLPSAGPRRGMDRLSRRPIDRTAALKMLKRRAERWLVG